MGSIINAEEKLDLFETSYRNKYFVDKSKILGILNVISVNMSELPRDCNDFKMYRNYFEDRISEELSDAFPECNIKMEVAVWDNLNKVYNKTKEGFIFIIDEWDS